MLLLRRCGLLLLWHSCRLWGSRCKLPLSCCHLLLLGGCLLLLLLNRCGLTCRLLLLLLLLLLLRASSLGCRRPGQCLAQLLLLALLLDGGDGERRLHTQGGL